jgi:hypothetical protein
VEVPELLREVAALRADNAMLREGAAEWQERVQAVEAERDEWVRRHHEMSQMNLRNVARHAARSLADEVVALRAELATEQTANAMNAADAARLAHDNAALRAERAELTYQPGTYWHRKFTEAEAEVERMRPVVEAAQAWADLKWDDVDAFRALASAVDAYREGSDG